MECFGEYIVEHEVKGSTGRDAADDGHVVSLDLTRLAIFLHRVELLANSATGFEVGHTATTRALQMFAIDPRIVKDTSN